MTKFIQYFVAALTVLPTFITSESFAPATEFAIPIPKISVKCTQSPLDFKEQYYNPGDGMCHPKDSKSTCSDTMILVSDDDATAAYREQHGWGLKIGKCGCESSLTQYPCRSFPVLYSEIQDKCFEMYTQGPCNPDEWFAPALPVHPTAGTRHRGVCKKNTCLAQLNASAPNSFAYGHWYEEKGGCYETGTRGHCGDPDEVAYFAENYPLPECGDAETIYGGCKEVAKNCSFDELYHERSEKCYVSGSQGPCPESMVFNFVDTERGQNYKRQFGEDVSFGKCECQLSAPSGSCTFRPYLFSPSAQNCIPAFSQGPCLDTEWFVPPPPGYLSITDSANGRLLRGVCTPNECLNNRTVHPNITVDEERIFYYGKDGECFLSGTFADCEDNESIAIFRERDLYPSCSFLDIDSVISPECQSTLEPALGATAGVASLGCSFGYKKRGQECIKPAEF